MQQESLTVGDKNGTFGQVLTRMTSNMHSSGIGALMFDDLVLFDAGESLDAQPAMAFKTSFA